MTDWRGLCAELVAAWDSWVQRADVIVNGNIDAVDATGRMVEAANEARTALAQPAPEGPSDEELRDLWSWSAAQDQGPWPTQQHCFARVVLARWGRPAIEPVPVSERPILKSGDFNDAEGRCWCGTTAFTDERGDLPIDYPMAWELREPCAQDDCVLPHWALPVPTSQEATDA